MKNCIISFFFNKEVIKLLRNIDGQFLYSVTSQCMMSEFWFHLFLQTLRYRFQDSSSDKRQEFLLIIR